MAVGDVILAHAVIFPQLLLILASAKSAPDSIVRLKPSEFPSLPTNIVRDLGRRGCTIPQAPWPKERHNVIRGSFAKPGQTDWAVLCAAAGKHTILIYWNASEANPTPLAPGEMSGPDRVLTAVGKQYILEHHKRYGGPKPPPIDHDGIDDAYGEKASVVHYLHAGKWLRLTGAD
jgi:hypothetical protein